MGVYFAQWSAVEAVSIVAMVAVLVFAVRESFDLHKIAKGGR